MNGSMTKHVSWFDVFVIFVCTHLSGKRKRDHSQRCNRMVWRLVPGDGASWVSKRVGIVG